MSNTTLWIETCSAAVDNGTMLITCSSGDTQFHSRMSFATFRRYAEVALHELDRHEGRSVLIDFPLAAAG